VGHVALPRARRALRRALRLPGSRPANAFGPGCRPGRALGAPGHPLYPRWLYLEEQPEKPLSEAGVRGRVAMTALFLGSGDWTYTMPEHGLVEGDGNEAG